MKKILFIIPPEKFRDEEILIPMEQFKNASILYDVAGTEIKAVHGMKGAEIMVTKEIVDIFPDDYEAFVVIGGQGTEKYLWNYVPLLNLLKLARVKGKYISGICAGSVVLAKAGLLEGIKATTFASEEFIHELKKSKAIYTGRNLEIAGRIITASGPGSAAEFGKAILDAMKIHTHDSVSMHINTPFDDV